MKINRVAKRHAVKESNHSLLSSYGGSISGKEKTSGGRVAKRHAGRHFLFENIQLISDNCCNQLVKSDASRGKKRCPAGTVMIDANFRVLFNP
ncbi:MAG: hypothetical protein GY705_18950 [Bacteroidetes bacterium]|nr:hypothetical protein [Bacteroidota bacterium]